MNIELRDNLIKITGKKRIVFDIDGEFQVKKELYVLFKFLNFADRNGLKVTDNVEVR